MKTLNEVIHALEVCTSGYCSNHDGDCPYLGHYKCNEEQRNLDALFYLKKYKANQEDPDGDHQQLEKARALLQDFYRNDPLTWDELKGMEGKPVWMEADDGKYKRWFIVGNFFSWFEKEDFDAHVNLYYSGGAMEMSKETYGSYWQAYRKERE